MHIYDMYLYEEIMLRYFKWSRGDENENLLEKSSHWVWYCSVIDLCLMYWNWAIWGSWMGFCYVMVSRLGIVPCQWANFTSRHNLTSGTWNIMHIICSNCTLNLLLWPAGVLLMSAAFILCAVYTCEYLSLRVGGIVSNTLRPTIPSYCDSEWRRLMEQCWAPNPAVRPSFTEIARRLRAMSSAASQAEGHEHKASK